MLVQMKEQYLENAGLAVEGGLGGLEKLRDLHQPRLFSS